MIFYQTEERKKSTMGMTMTQKILAAHAGLDSVQAGQLINAKLDMVLGNDITSPVAINEFKKAGFTSVFDKEKISLVMDHFVPNKDIKAAEQSKQCREFAGEMGITNFYDVGNMGVEHALLPEKGLVGPGECIIGADSHTCTYGALGAFSTGVGSTDMAAGMATGQAWFKVPSAIRFELTGKLNKYVSGKDVILHIIGKIGVDGALYRSMEFTGPGLASLSMEDRLCMANMAIEAGAKNGIFAVDDITLAYVKDRVNRLFTVYEADEDAEYDEVIEIDLSQIKSTVSFPHLPENTKTIDQVGDIKIDQVVIGSCTNGRLSDLAVAAEILKGKKVAKNVRAIIIPATQQIYMDAMKLGYLETFIQAGCAVSTPTCGPCLGGYMGILADGERAVATTNRNFVGRMGHVNSEVYLASPAVAAASAIAGKIAGPEQD
jgi:3-isopropylmalate/(R)-2-methylmalate dehydratase large subunit